MTEVLELYYYCFALLNTRNCNIKCNIGLFFFCQVTDMINGKGQNVYRLPLPTPCPVSTSGEPINLRIPQTEKPNATQVLYNMWCELLIAFYSQLLLLISELQLTNTLLSVYTVNRFSTCFKSSYMWPHGTMEKDKTKVCFYLCILILNSFQWLWNWISLSIRYTSAVWCIYEMLTKNGNMWSVNILFCLLQWFSDSKREWNLKYTSKVRFYVNLWYKNMMRSKM